MSLLDKAYACAVEEKFDRFLEAFSQEVDDYLDELMESLMPPSIVIEPEKGLSIPPEVPGEMEEFMEKMAKRKKNLRKK